MKLNFKNLHLILTQLSVALTLTFAPTQAADFSALKISESEIRSSLKESQKITDRLMSSRRQIGQLSPAQKALVKAIEATKESIRMNGTPDIAVDNQPPGNSVLLKSINMKFKGFVAIERSNVIGVTPLLPIGVTKNIRIPLSEHVDGTSLLAYFYKDNGDGVFDARKDGYVNEQRNRVFREFEITTKRDLKNSYYSNTLNDNGEATLIIVEQPAGNKIEFTNMNPPCFVAIFKDKNGLPDKFIGNNAVTKSNRVYLLEPVSDEMLYAVMYKDNGDGKFDLMSDSPARGKSGLIIIVKFKVTK